MLDEFMCLALSYRIGCKWITTLVNQEYIIYITPLHLGLASTNGNTQIDPKLHLSMRVHGTDIVIHV